MRDYFQERKDILSAGGEAYAIFPVGRALNEAADFTTVTSVGSGALDGLVGTYAPGARTAFDVPVAFIRNQEKIPGMTGNGSDENMTTPDIDAWSRDDSSGEGMSWESTIYLIGNNAGIWSKNGGASNREWRYHINSSSIPFIALVDQSVPVEISRPAGSAIPTLQWTHLIATVDGSGGATAANGINWYINGVLNNGTATNNASYVAMENLAATPALWSGEEAATFLQCMLLGGEGGPAFTHRVLSAVEAFNLNNISVAMRRPFSTRHWYR